MGTFENIEAIFNYRQLKSILGKDGQIFTTKVHAFNKDKLIYDGKYSIVFRIMLDTNNIKFLSLGYVSNIRKYNEPAGSI